MHCFSSSRQAGGKRPPWVATPTSAVVGSYAERIGNGRDDGDSVERLAGPSRVDDGDGTGRARSGSRRARSSRSAGRRSGPQRGSDTASLTPSPGRSGGSWTPSTSSTPGHGSSTSRRLPSRSTWSNRLATWAPAETARPDSFMQPSIRPRPSARPACAIRTASRIPPDLASLTVSPCARSAHAGTSVERVAVLVGVDRQRRAALQLGAVRVAGRQRLLAVLDAERGQLRQRLERLVERPASFTSTCSGTSATSERRGPARRRACRAHRASASGA